jgi:hypothetical protein
MIRAHDVAMLSVVPSPRMIQQESRSVAVGTSTARIGISELDRGGKSDRIKDRCRGERHDRRLRLAMRCRQVVCSYLSGQLENEQSKAITILLNVVYVLG